jgi:hypothetical protein
MTRAQVIEAKMQSSGIKKNFAPRRHKYFSEFSGQTFTSLHIVKCIFLNNKLPISQSTKMT